jgi:hypothetical protein
MTTSKIVLGPDTRFAPASPSLSAVWSGGAIGASSPHDADGYNLAQQAHANKRKQKQAKCA